MMRNILLILLLCGPCMESLLAQGAAPDPFSGEAAFGYLATSGNTDSTNVNAAIGLLWARGDWSHEVDWSAVAATSANETTAEAYSTKYESRRAVGDRGYVFTSLDWRENRFSAFDRQLSESIGYGRRFIDRERHVLNAEVGSGARQAKLVDGSEENEAILRFATDYSLIFSEMTGFSHDLIVESGSSNTSIESIAALRARLVGNLALVFSYRIKRNSDVPADIEDTDTFTSVALEYAF